MELSSQGVQKADDDILPESTVLLNSTVEAGNWELVKDLLSNGDNNASDAKNSLLLQKLASAKCISLLIVRNILRKLFEDEADSQLLKHIAEGVIVDAAKNDSWDMLIVFLSETKTVLENENNVLFIVQAMAASQILRTKKYLHMDVLRALWVNSKQKIVECRDKRVQNTLVQLAAELNMWSRVCDLLVSKPDLNLLDRDGLSVLHRLVMCPDSRFDSLLPVLLENGADVTLKTCEGDTALHLAATHQTTVRDRNDKMECTDIKSKIMNEYHTKRAEAKLQALTLLLTSAKTLDDCDSKGNTAAILAAKNSNWEFFKMLLEHGARADVVGECQRSVLHVLVLTGSSMDLVTYKTLVTLCVSSGALINARDADGCTAMHLAACSHKWTLFRILADLGADTRLTDAEGYNVLHRLAMTSSEQAENVCQLFHFLHQQGADLNAQCSAGNTVLHLASVSNNVALVKCLIHLGASIHDLSSEGYAVLHLLAVTQNQSTRKATGSDVSSVIDLLLQKGADREIRCSSGDTALQLAARYHNWTVVKHLLWRGAMIHEVDSEGVTFMERFIKNSTECTEKQSIFLLQHSAVTKTRSRHGDSVLQLAAKHEKWAVADHILRHKGGDQNERDSEGFTLLQRIAITLGKTFPGWLSSYVMHALVTSDILRNYELRFLVQMADRAHTVEVLYLLLNIFSDVNMTDWEGFTLLHRVTQFIVPNTVAIIRCLVERGAYLEKPCPNGNTAVHLAAKSNNWLAVHQLLKCGAGATALDSEGYSVLHRLLRQPNMRCNQCRQGPAVKKPVALLVLLLYRGKLTNQRDPNGHTPLHLAVKHEHWDMAIELMARGALLMERDLKGHTILHVLASRHQEDVNSSVGLASQVQTINSDVDRRMSRETCVTCSIGDDQEGTFNFFSSDLMKKNFNHLDMCGLFVAHKKLIDALDPQGNTALMLSAIHNNWDVTQQLLIQGAKPDLLNKDGLTLLHILASVNSSSENVLSKDIQKDILERIITFGVVVSARDPEGNTPIQLAAKHGNMDMVERLLEFQHNVNETDSEGFTLLSRVAQSLSPRCEHIAIRLLKKGADVNMTCPDGKTPITLSVTSRNWSFLSSVCFFSSRNISNISKQDPLVLHHLLKSSKDDDDNAYLLRSIIIREDDIITRRSANGMSAIQLAFKETCWTAIPMFLECGAETDPEPLLGESVFHGLVKCVLCLEPEELIDIDFISNMMPTQILNINLRNDDGDTPLNALARLERWDCVKLLLEQGADVGLPDSDGWTLFHRLAMADEWYGSEVCPSQFLATLAEKGSDINVTGPNGKTPIMIALEEKHWPIFWHLVQLGAKLDWGRCDEHLILKNIFRIPTRHIQEEHLTPVARILIKDCSKPMYTETSNCFCVVQRSFERCIMFSKWATAKILLECGADVDIKRLLDGKTQLLHTMASLYRKEDHCKWISLLDDLLSRGLVINCRNSKGKTILMKRNVIHSLAESKETADVLFKTLLEKGCDPLLVDNMGNSFLFNALDFGDTSSILTSLIQLGVIFHLPRLGLQQPCLSLMSPMKKAIKKGNISVLKILIECGTSPYSELFSLNTEYHNENAVVIVTDPQVQQMSQVLDEAATQPRSLESLCRLAVSRCLPYSLNRKDMVMSLPIPPVLKDYLMFPEVLSQAVSREGEKRRNVWAPRFSDLYFSSDDDVPPGYYYNSDSDDYWE